MDRLFIREGQIDEITPRGKKGFYFFLLNDMFIKAKTHKGDRSKYDFVSKIEWSKTTLTEIKNQIQLVEAASGTFVCVCARERERGEGVSINVTIEEKEETTCSCSKEF